ncbi:phenylalanine--tRNA ligase subunit beta [Dokdonella sp.]|uniref:phenylalanine--tRNA ligase subunit beta n=1 Tax=Dokdonella sp. TaxID=2291710 RepID=UPI0035271ACC
MKFSENWLRELVDIPVAREALVQRLTMSGLEVEDVEILGANLDGVIIGEIVAAEKHPDADKLRVCRVEAGLGAPLQIVCGAPNARVGLKAPLATVGTRVGTVTIKTARLRGVESNGMLCSGRELGFDSDADGLFELAADAPVGKPLAAWMGFPDAAIELGLTPNRADCLGMVGLAREVGAEFGISARPVQIPEQSAAIEDVFKVELQAPAACPRYCGRILRGVNARAATPQWMIDRLRRAGIRPISAVVDVTAYVMLELGQPMHAFDAATLHGPIVVRAAGKGEKLKLLDERTVELDEEFLVIADQDKPVALGGIMGGHDTRVTDATQDVFLEAAHFASGSISGRARRLGMHTDASHRYERGVDAELPRQAIERATALVLEICGGSVGPLIEESSPAHLPARSEIALRRSRLGRILGIEVADSEVSRILESLGMKVTKTEQGWSAIPPSARFDLAIEEDLIEEVARIHGYDRIPVQAPRGEITPVSIPEDRVALSLIREQLAARAYAEAINFAFVDAELLQTWGMGEDAIALKNPLSAELAVMRTSLLPGLVAALDRNRKRQQLRVRLFETGRSYHEGKDAPVEIERIAGVAIGDADGEQWGTARRKLDFFDIKGDVESLIRLTGADATSFEFRSGGPSWLHPGRSATIWRGDRVIGFVGALDPRLQGKLDLDDDVHVFELQLEGLSWRSVPVARPLSRFPSLRRDIAVLISDSVACSEIEASIRAAVGEHLVDLVLFDQYAGSNLGNGVRSLAMGLILQDRSRTLTDQDADQCVDLAVSALATGYNAKLRG